MDKFISLVHGNSMYRNFLNRESRIFVLSDSSAGMDKFIPLYDFDFNARMLFLKFLMYIGNLHLTINYYHYQVVITTKKM